MSTPLDFAGAVQGAAAGQMRTETLARLKHLLLAAAGIGMGARGMMGLYHIGKRHLGPAPRSQVAPISIEVPIAESQEKEAEGGLGQALLNFFRGEHAHAPEAIPWAIPAFTLGGAGAAYGGWKLMDHLLDARRRSGLQKQLEEARRQFHEVLAEPPAGEEKTAQHSPLRQELDALFDDVERLEKTAEGDSWPNVFDAPGHYLGIGAGVYGTAAGMTALGTAMAVYEAMKKRQTQSLLEKARKKRLQRLYGSQPLPLEAQFKPV